MRHQQKQTVVAAVDTHCCSYSSHCKKTAIFRFKLGSEVRTNTFLVKMFRSEPVPCWWKRPNLQPSTKNAKDERLKYPLHLYSTVLIEIDNIHIINFFLTCFKKYRIHHRFIQILCFEPVGLPALTQHELSQLTVKTP